MLKSVTYRLLIVITNSIIVYALTRSFDMTLGVILFSNLLNTIMYFVHERFWSRVHWGKFGLETVKKGSEYSQG